MRADQRKSERIFCEPVEIKGWGAPVESWLREEVAPGHKEYLADASKGVPAG